MGAVQFIDGGNVLDFVKKVADILRKLYIQQKESDCFYICHSKQSKYFTYEKVTYFFHTFLDKKWRLWQCVLTIFSGRRHNFGAFEAAKCIGGLLVALQNCSLHLYCIVIVI